MDPMKDRSNCCDYECPFCGPVQPIVKEIRHPLGDLCFDFQPTNSKRNYAHANH